MFEAVGKRLGQPVMIENKPGANSTIGVDPDRARTGRRLPLRQHAGRVHGEHVAVQKAALPAQRLRGRQPCWLDLPMFLFAANKLPVKNAKELAEYGKKNPAELRLQRHRRQRPHDRRALGAGNGLNAQHVPYNGSAPILADLMSWPGRHAV